MGICTFGSFFTLHREKNRSFSLEGDPPVFLISVRNWSALDFEKMSQLKARMTTCDEYTQAVTPHTLEIPAYAALLSAKHPLHIPLWTNEQRPTRSLRTINQVFSKERYNTAAFITDEMAKSFGDRFGVFDSPSDSSLSLIQRVRRFFKSFKGVRSLILFSCIFRCFNWVNPAKGVISMISFS